MRISSLHVSDFRQVDVTIPLASATVLFGQNDSGKSNILDAVEATFTQNIGSRADAFGDPDPELPTTVVRLDLDAMTVEGSYDQRLFFEWSRSFLSELESPTENQMAVIAQLVDVPALPIPLESQQGPLVAEFVRDFIALIRSGWLDETTFTSDQARTDYEQLLDRCLESRRFQVGFDAEWIAPDVSALGPGERAALERLQSDSSFTGDPLVERISAPGGGFVELSGEGGLSKVARVERFDFAGGDFSRLYDELGRFIRESLF